MMQASLVVIGGFFGVVAFFSTFEWRWLRGAVVRGGASLGSPTGQKMAYRPSYMVLASFAIAGGFYGVVALSAP